MEKGGISVSTENIFPVIKRWLYSDKDIFLREVVSNSSDAVTKHKHLVSLGTAKDEESDYKISVVLNKDEKTLTVSDNGIGMTEDEVKRYINQIALSGALEFIDKYESAEGNSSGIIGHFGLGFYSVFMVAEKAEIITKSFDGSPAVHWTCDECGEYEIEETTRDCRGTDVILRVSEDEEEYLNPDRLKEILKKYCSYMPYPIFFKDGENEEQINETMPLWQKDPKDCTKEEYNEFYHKLTGDINDPLMYVHIRVDYPLNFKGILFFPKIRAEFESPEPKVSLYYNQVYVADNIKELLPDFLIYVRGVLDCPEIPLNVSRSYLQSNNYVSKVSGHIAKKVADRITTLFANEREELEKVYDDLSMFIEYACLRDGKFYDRVKDSVMFTLTDGKNVTLPEYTDGKDEATVYYVTDKKAHAYYVSAYNAKGIKVVDAKRLVDTSFIQMLESKNEKIKFRRIDSETDALGDNNEDEELKKLFAEVTGKKEECIKFASLGEDASPALITQDEESRRFGDMMKMYGYGDGMPKDDGKEILTVNISSSAVTRIKSVDENRKKVSARFIYLSALLISRQLTAEEMTEYVKLSSEILTMI